MNIWYRAEGQAAEVVDTCNRADVAYTLREYALAFGCAPGQQRCGRDKVWAGRRVDEPKEEGVRA